MKMYGEGTLATCALGVVCFAATAPAADRIPITTSSEEARKLYLEGRDLSEKLRATDARQRFEAAAAKDPGFALAQVGLANTAGTAKEFFAATERAVELSTKGSEPERLVICALDAGGKGEPDRQHGCLTRLLQAVPDDERAHNLMGQYHFGRQDYAAAVAAYEKATSLNPGFSQPYNQMGYAYRFMGRYPEAEKAFKKYIELIPGDPNPYDSYAELLMKTGRLEESIKNYEKALAVDPNFIASYIGIGNDRVFMGQPEEARKAYARLLSVARNDGERRQGHFWMAMSYVHEGATDKALAEVREMAAIDETGKDLVNLSGAQNQMGDILIEAGRIDEAAAKYKEQLATIDRAEVPAQVKEATHRQALFDEARVALARHDLAGAKAKAAAYGTAVAVRKIPFEVRQTHELAGRIALEEKKPALAVTELARANQQDPRVLYLLAVAHEGAGDPVKAKQAGVQAADFNALSATYGYVRGKAKAMVTVQKKD
jgi:tetratricopeptide (TPR) repeat protein